MPTWFAQRLYLRIWLAVVCAVVLLSVLAAWLWRMDLERERAERPGREVVVRNAQGDMLGQAPSRPVRMGGHGPIEFQVTMNDGQTLFVQLPRPNRPPPGMHQSDWRPPTLGFATLLALVALAVALGTYPVVRWLTQRLEALQQGVERWGEGDLSVRMPVQGQDEVAFLAQRFNVAAERVQALVNSHKALLANASHELRSPLARIRMGLELLDTAPAAQRAAQRTEITRNIAELDQLIDEILLASRMDAADAPALQLESIDLTGLAAEECARTGAQLNVLAQPQVEGDARLVRRLLRNLLENARRHGSPSAGPQGLATPPPEPEVDLTLAQTVVKGVPHATVTVDDHGPGVPEAMRNRIFEPFFRLSGASERDGGVGLGLALVKTIATQHGGAVRCEAGPGGGARFVVVLPLTQVN